MASAEMHTAGISWKRQWTNFDSRGVDGAEAWLAPRGVMDAPSCEAVVECGF
jgi:hypothetical protein